MLYIIIKETKEFLREKTNLFFFLLFPVMLVFLLGNLLSSMDKSEATVGEIKLGYLIQTENDKDVMAIDSFIASVADNHNLSFEKVEDLEISKARAAKDEITAVVVFKGEPLEINIYEGTNNVKNRTVGAIINGFTKSYQSISAVMKTVPSAMVKGIGSQEEYLKQKDLGVTRTMLDYYAISMLAMISFMSVILGSMAFVMERQSKTINRLIIAPKNRVIMFLSKILGLVPQVILQITIIMIVSVFVFKAHYASNILDNLYLFFLFTVVTFAMIAIGVVIGFLIKINPLALIMPVLWVMMFLGGTYSKEINIKGISSAMPIRKVQDAAFDLAVFGRYQKVNLVIIICIIIMIIMLSIGAFLFSKKEEER